MKYLTPFTPLNEAVSRQEPIGRQDPWHDIKVCLGALMVDFYGFDAVDYKANGITIESIDYYKKEITFYSTSFGGQDWHQIIIVFEEKDFFKELKSIITDWFNDLSLVGFNQTKDYWEIRFDKNKSKEVITEINKLRSGEKWKEYIIAKKFGI